MKKISIVQDLDKILEKYKNEKIERCGNNHTLVILKRDYNGLDLTIKDLKLLLNKVDDSVKVRIKSNNESYSKDLDEVYIHLNRIENSVTLILALD